MENSIKWLIGIVIALIITIGILASRITTLSEEVRDVSAHIKYLNRELSYMRTEINLYLINKDHPKEK